MAKGRGELFESRIETVCKQYEEQNIAMIHRTEGKWRGTSRGKAFLTNSEKGMPDFLGSFHKNSVVVEAKSCKGTAFELRNWKPEQVKRMEKHYEQGALAFLLIEFQKYEEIYRIPFPDAYAYWKDAQDGGRQSIPHTDMDRFFRVQEGRHTTLDFLKELA